MKKAIVLFLLCLIVPVCALAVTEGVVEDAPQVQMESVGLAGEAEVSYLPDSSYYAYDTWLPAWENDEEWTGSYTYDGEMYEDVYQNPRLTAGEAKRALRLLEQYKAGTLTYTGENVLEKMEDVVVGVYALDPADYDGETVFTLLPGPQMTDEQLLAVIDAHAQLGLEFDPAKLNARNCMRGGGIESNRFFADEERERYAMLNDKIRRGIIAADAAYEGLLRNPRLDSAYFCGGTDFSIKPYRSMTDEELVSLLMSIGVKDESETTDFDDVERRSRQALREYFACPLSMQLSSIYAEGSYVPRVFTADGGADWMGEGRFSYGVNFTYRTAEGILVYAYTMYDKETGELVSANAMHDSEWGANDPLPEERGITQERIDEAIRGVEEALGLSGLTWHVRTEDETWTNWGACVPVRAQLEEGLWMTVYIGADDGKQHGMAIDRGTLVEKLPEWPEQEDE